MFEEKWPSYSEFLSLWSSACTREAVEAADVMRPRPRDAKVSGSPEGGAERPETKVSCAVEHVGEPGLSGGTPAGMSSVQNGGGAWHPALITSSEMQTVVAAFP